MENGTTTKKITYGSIRVTLPMSIKNTMLSWWLKSGMGKTEFFRVALMMGIMQLSEQVKAKSPNEGYAEHDR